MITSFTFSATNQTIVIPSANTHTSGSPGVPASFFVDEAFPSGVTAPAVLFKMDALGKWVDIVVRES